MPPDRIVDLLSRAVGCGWILGSLKVPINTANNSRAIPITVYGILTEAACSTR